MPQLLSSSVNQDGKSASFMAPNGLSQQAVITRACSGKRLFAVETHGTGTALGDPIEVGAITRSRLQNFTEACVPLGAIKSNVGHTEFAAGVGGVLKVILVLCSRQELPNLNMNQLNPFIESEDSFVTVPCQVGGLAIGKDAKMGSSALGFTGTNAFAVLASGHSVEVATEKRFTTKFQCASFVWWDCNTDVGPGTTEALTRNPLHADENSIWQHSWPQSTCNYAAHHRVGVTPLAPGTAFLQLARHALADTGNALTLHELKFAAMLHLDGTQPTLRVTRSNDQLITVESSHDGSAWMVHAEMAVAAVQNGVASVPSIVQAVIAQRRASQELVALDCSCFYGITGNNYLGEFRSVQAAWLGKNEKEEMVVLTKVAFADDTLLQQVASAFATFLWLIVY